MHRAIPTMLLLFAVFAVFGAAAVCRAAEAVPPSESQLRAAVAKSLGYLAREGERWMTEKDCNSCHHLPELIWTHREAKQRGFPIDQAKLESFIGWAKEREIKSNAGLEMTAFLKLAMPESPAPALTELILAGQQSDGTWKPANQFLAQRRDAVETVATSARLFALALAVDGIDREAAGQARARASSFTETNAPSVSVDTLVYRLLYAQRFGSPDEAVAWRAELLKAQHDDGGWSWVIDDAPSDPLATGEALHALEQSRDASSRPAMARAQAWLLSRQNKDGSWPIDLAKISRKDRSSPDQARSLSQATEIYTYWGTGWATIGLLQGVPIAKP